MFEKRGRRTSKPINKTPTSLVALEIATVSVTQNGKEETMYTENQQKTNYLDQRLTALFWAKNNELHKAFHLTSEEPATYEEALQRIKEGKFKFPTKKELEDREDDGSGYDSYSFGRLIQWRTEDKDWDGYNAAYTAMQKAQTEAKDAIMIGTPDEGLKAVKEFEAKTFH